MKVEIIEATPNAEELCCRAARNDYGANATADFEEVMKPVDGETIEEKKENLLRKLIKQQHYGVLEHAQASFSIKDMSRVVMAQATRHRHLSWDIESQRYVDFSDPDYTIPPSFTNPEHFTRDDGSVELTEEEQKEMKIFFKEWMEMTAEEYEEYVKKGIPKEDARYILPTGMQVNAVMSGNLRALMHVVNMRSKANVQKETRDLANGVSEEIEEWVPTIHKIFDEQMPMKLGL